MPIPCSHLGSRYQLVRVDASACRYLGTGKDVNDETIADAGEPLTIRWSNRSWLELSVRRP